MCVCAPDLLRDFDCLTYFYRVHKEHPLLHSAQCTSSSATCTKTINSVAEKNPGNSKFIRHGMAGPWPGAGATERSTWFWFRCSCDYGNVLLNSTISQNYQLLYHGNHIESHLHIAIRRIHQYWTIYYYMRLIVRESSASAYWSVIPNVEVHKAISK